MTLLGVRMKFGMDDTDVQSTSAKNQTNSQLLCSAHGKQENLANRHRKQHKIGGDLNSGIGDPPGLVLEALVLLYASVPEGCDWRALEGGSNDEGQA